MLNVEVANNHSLSASRTGSARLPTLIGAEEISNIPSFQSAAGQNKRVISSSETSRAPSRAGSRTARKSVVETEGRKPPVGKKVTKDAAETEGRGVKRGRSTRAQGRDKVGIVVEFVAPSMAFCVYSGSRSYPIRSSNCSIGSSKKTKGNCIVVHCDLDIRMSRLSIEMDSYVQHVCTVRFSLYMSLSVSV